MGSSKIRHVMTLANSIIGVAILAMPFCFQKCGIILSIVLIITINLVTRISCHYLVKSSIICRRKSMEVMAFYIFGSSGKLMVELCTIGYLMGTCVAYFVVVGDLGPQIIAKLFDMDYTSTLRTWTMVLVTLFCVLPLGMLKNVDSLSVVCTASIGFYFCLVLKIMAEAKQHIRDGDWMEHVEYWKLSGVLQCLPIFSLSLSCQMVIFEVYDTVANGSLEKMNDIVKTAVTMCTGVYILVGFFGYVAFCQQPFSGNILLSLEPTFASDVIKIGFVLSVACSFPLVIFPCRASFYSLLYRRGHSEVAHYIPEHRFKLITISMIVLALIVGILIPSIELIIGLVGSTIGVAICIMFPASCFIKIGKKNSTEKLLAQMILVFGFFLMILGTYANLTAIDEQSSGPNHIVDEPVMPQIDLPANLTNSIEDPRLDDGLQLPNSFVKEIDLLDSKFPNSVELRKVETDIEVAPEGAESDVAEKKVANESPSNESKKENDINREAILREDQEIAIGEQEQSDVKVEISRLEKTKSLLIKQVQEIKEDLKKQNQETQNLVLQKFDEIAGKVDDIEKDQANQEEKKEETVLQKAANTDGILTKNQTIGVLTDPITIKETTKNTTQKEANFRMGDRDNPVVKLLIKNQVNASSTASVADANNESVVPDQPSDDNKPVVDLPVVSLNSAVVEPVPDSGKQPETIAKIDLDPLKVDVTNEVTTPKVDHPLIPDDKLTPALPYNEKVGRDILNLYEKTSNSTVREKREADVEENCAETTTKVPTVDLKASAVVESNQVSEPQISNSGSVVDDTNVAYGRDLKSAVEVAYTANSSDL